MNFHFLEIHKISGIYNKKHSVTKYKPYCLPTAIDTHTMKLLENMNLNFKGGLFVMFINV